MILKSPEFQFFALFYNKLSQGTQAHIQKIYSTPCHLALQLRLPGESKVLILGRGNQFEGAWLGESFPDPGLRIKERYLEYCRKHLIGGRLLSLETPYGDRLLRLNYIKWGRTNSFTVFYRGRSLYFSHLFYLPKKDRFELFFSWAESEEGAHEELKELESLGYANLGVKDFGKNEKAYDVHRDVFSDELKYLLKNLSSSGKKQKFQERKIDKIKKDLLRCSSWERLSQVIDDYDFGRKRIVQIEGVKIKLNPHFNHFQNKDLVYKKIKSLKKGFEIQNKRFEEVQAEVKVNTSDGFSEEDLRKSIRHPVWSQKQRKPLNRSVDFDTYTFKSYKVAVGKNANQNDQIRSLWAKKEDLWFHLEDRTSSHLILKGCEFSDLEIDDFRIIASVIRDYSKLELLEIPLVFTKVKNINSIKGMPGAVRYKKEKHMLLNYDKDWRSRLKRL